MAHHELRKGPHLAHSVQLLAVKVVAPSAVTHHRSSQDRGAVVAQVLTPRSTPVAPTTGGDERCCDMVTHCQRFHAGSQFRDDTCALVASDHGEHGLDPVRPEFVGGPQHVPVSEVLVGMAHAGEGHFDHHLVTNGGVDVNLFYLPRLVEPSAHCCREFSSIRPSGSHGPRCALS